MTEFALGFVFGALTVLVLGLLLLAVSGMR